MSFFHAANLVTKTLSPSTPWDFKPTESLTAQIRFSKEDRQNWYQSSGTNHSFYTGLEGANSQLRVSKENPVRLIHAFVADYDITIPKERIDEVIKGMATKPQWIETSLGGHFRLVWVLEKPMLVDDTRFATFILQKAKEWLALDSLPGLDAPAFETATRLYCNGCEWRPVSDKPLPAPISQAFFVKCGRDFRFKAGDDEQVPLDVVEAALKEKYPNFLWENAFELETQGPTFWIPESASSQSAIVKAGGMFTFSAHAAKPFYSWTDLLGADFTKKFNDGAISKATEEIWWDSKRFWRKINGLYVSLDKTELMTYFKVTCRLSSKPGQNGITQVDAALDHIFNQQRITGAAPFVFQRPGLVVFGGERKLNIYSGKPVEPAAESQIWSENFPFMAYWLDNIFTTPTQLTHFLAWFKHYYTSACEWKPRPGQNIFLMGGAGIGKTLLNRQVIGVSVGGYVDASDYLIESAAFNAHLVKSPHWALDDDNPSNSIAAQARMQAMFKKTAANQQMIYSQKYEQSSMTEWMGRIGCTTNLDYVSSRIVGPLDNSSLDKTCLFRCHPSRKSSSHRAMKSPAPSPENCLIFSGSYWTGSHRIVFPPTLDTATGRFRNPLCLIRAINLPLPRPSKNC